MTTLDFLLHPVIPSSVPEEETEIPDEIENFDNCTKNMIFSEFGEKAMAILYDLFVSRTGPRFRYHQI